MFLYYRNHFCCYWNVLLNILTETCLCAAMRFNGINDFILKWYYSSHFTNRAALTGLVVHSVCRSVRSLCCTPLWSLALFPGGCMKLSSPFFKPQVGSLSQCYLCLTSGLYAYMCAHYHSIPQACFGLYSQENRATAVSTRMSESVCVCRCLSVCV